MKKIQNKSLFAVLFAVMGLAACGLIRWLYGSAVDERGLLTPWSVPEILIWVLTACALVGAFLIVRGTALGQANRILSAIGDLVFAGGVASLIVGGSFSLDDVSSAFSRIQAGYRRAGTGPAKDIVIILTFAIAALAFLSLAASFVQKLMGKKVYFVQALFPCIVCGLLLVQCYQLWSEVPQMMDYVLALGAGLSLTLTAMYRLLRAAGLPLKSRHAGFSLLAVFFCCAALTQGDFTLFFASGAVWALTDLSALQEAA